MSGNFHIRLIRILDPQWPAAWPTNAKQYLFSMQTASGLWAAYWQNQVITGVVNGSDPQSGFVQNAADLNYALYGPAWFGIEMFNYPTLRPDIPTTRQCGLTISVNGCSFRNVEMRAAAQTFSTPTAFEIGSNLGTAGSFLPARWKLVDLACQRHPDQAEGILFGDSIIATYNSYLTRVGPWIYTYNQSVDAVGIVDYSGAGLTAENMLNEWQNGGTRGRSDIRWCFIMIGINNAINGQDAPTTTQHIQDLIDDFKQTQPNARILLAQLTPCKAGVTAPQFSVMQTINTNINGTGPNPIVGQNIFRLPAWTELDDGTGNLRNLYDSGDGLHPNALGRLYIASQIRNSLRSLGLI